MFRVCPSHLWISHLSLLSFLQTDNQYALVNSQKNVQGQIHSYVFEGGQFLLLLDSGTGKKEEFDWNDRTEMGADEEGETE